jgi:DNA-directed RNA polymerase specialized sigma24 family protein
MSPPQGELGADWLLQHASWIRRLAQSLVSDRALAEDLVQDTWVAALTYRPTTGRSMRPWLSTVLRNLARKAVRTRRHLASREAKAAEPSEPAALRLRSVASCTSFSFSTRVGAAAVVAPAWEPALCFPESAKVGDVFA